MDVRNQRGEMPRKPKGDLMFVKLFGIAAALMLAAGAAMAADLTDPQIAHIAYTAGQIDVTAGQLALQKSQNAEVRAFAQNMVDDHTAVNEQALALLKKLNVTPEDNDTSKALTAAAEAKAKELTALDGAAFDKAYLENEIAYHKTVNGALEGTLIPSTMNGELKDLLSTGLKVFQGHQEHAEQVAAMLK